MAHQVKIDQQITDKYTLTVTLSTDWKNEMANIRARYTPTQDNEECNEAGLRAAFMWMQANYAHCRHWRIDWMFHKNPGYDGYFGADNLKPEHARLVGHPYPIEPSSTHRAVAYNEATKKWETIYPESETYAGQRLIEQWLHESTGRWMTVPEE